LITAQKGKKMGKDMTRSIARQLLTETAETVLSRRYYLKDGQGNVLENWESLCRRVADAVAAPDRDREDFELLREQFFRLIHHLDFLPNSPCLMNAGTDLGQLSACFVLPVEDSMDGIFTSIHHGALVHKTGGGTGYSFSRLRPKNSAVRSTQGVASGPLSFAAVFDAATETIKQGGKRRGANMGILRVDHPDIMDFITAKQDQSKFTNFNFSVAVTDKFMEAAKNNQEYDLIDPSNRKTVCRMNAAKVFDKIIDLAWHNGEPGVLFIDAANRANPIPQLGEFEATNPSLMKGTRVWTSEGIKRIEELEGSTFNVRNLHGELSSACCWKSGENEALFSIRLKGGHTHNATPQHKWPILLKDGYIIRKRTDELKEGDWIFKGGFEERISYGTKYTREQGFMVGWNLGDGWQTLRKNGRMQYGFIVDGDKRQSTILNQLQKALSDLGCNTDLFAKKEINLSHSALISFFEEIGCRGKEYGLPDRIWDSASEDFIRGLIDGLYSSDGSFDISNGGAVYTTKDEKMAFDLSDLLSFYGIKSSVRKSHISNGQFPNGKIYGRVYTRYDVVVKSYTDIVQFSQLFKLSHAGKQDQLVSIVNSLPERKRVIFSDFLRIEEIKFGETVSDVWDISVHDKTHCFKISHVITGNCGEQFLLPYQSCNLGSINLGQYVKDGAVDYLRLGQTVRTAVRFLDNVIDCNRFPIPEIAEMTLKTRPIGLGIMGLHDMLIQLELSYGDEEGRCAAAKVMRFIRDEAEAASIALAEQKGPFPAWDAQHNHYPARRNAALTSIQPTGTVSMIADCASGCEPYFSVVTEKNVMDNDRFLMINKHFEHVAKREGFFSEELMRQVAQSGTVLGHAEIPEKWQRIFLAAQDIAPEDHIRMQGALQTNGVDSSISKTINLPATATKEDVRLSYQLGFELGCKGLTVYRDGSRDGQVLSTAASAAKKTATVSSQGELEKKELPDVLDAKRYRLKDADGNSIYLIVCFDEKENPMEVFAKFPFDNRLDLKDKSTMWTTTCRLVSLALRYQIPMEEIIRQLDRSSGHMLDLPAQLGRLLKSFMAGTQKGFTSSCPECCGTLVYAEGCEVCRDCGYSRCS
jgi:ribonucleotide reductase alpha subunit